MLGVLCGLIFFLNVTKYKRLRCISEAAASKSLLSSSNILYVCVCWQDVAYALSLVAAARTANRYRDSCNCRIADFVVALQRCCCDCIVVATAMPAALATEMIALIVAVAIVQATANKAATAQFVNMEATGNIVGEMVEV